MEKAISFLKQLYRQIEAADVFGLAAQLAYFFLLSLFPFLLFLVTLLGYLPIDASTLMDLIETYAPDQIHDLIQANLNQLVNHQNGGLLSIGIIGTLWSASNGVNAITRAFNKAYHVEKNRSFITARFIAIILTLAMIAVIIMALLLPVFGNMIGEYLFSLFHLSDHFLKVWEMMRILISTIFIFVVLLALYILAPNARITIKHAIWGALFATFSWQLVSLGFSYYVNTLSHYSATYGSLGTVIVLMIWFYMTGIIIIMGGVINATILHYRK